MIKNCRILINNDAVTVFDYDGAEIQVPSINREARTVKVLCKDGKYTIVDDNYIEPVEKVQFKDKSKKDYKKTTVDNDAKEIIADESQNEDE